jgi:winged helix-turn-helix protein
MPERMRKRETIRSLGPRAGQPSPAPAALRWCLVVPRGCVQGRPWKLSVPERERLCARLESGPREDDSVCTLRGRDLQRILQKEFGKLYHLNGVYSLLHRLGYSSLMPRPQHRHADPLAQEAFKKNSRSGWKRSVPPIPKKRSKSGSKTKRGSVSRAH